MSRPIWVVFRVGPKEKTVPCCYTNDKVQAQSALDQFVCAYVNLGRMDNLSDDEILFDERELESDALRPGKHARFVDHEDELECAYRCNIHSLSSNGVISLECYFLMFQVRGFIEDLMEEDCPAQEFLRSTFQKINPRTGRPYEQEANMDPSDSDSDSSNSSSSEASLSS